MEGWKQGASAHPADFEVDNAAVIVPRSRILVSKSSGITLGVLLLLSTMLILHVFYMTRLVRRPLGLYQDPGKIESAAALLLEDDHLKQRLLNVDRLPQKHLDSRLDGCVLGMTSGKLVILSREDRNLRDGMCRLTFSSMSHNLHM